MNIGRKISATIGITLMWAISAVNITIGELLVVRSGTYKYHIGRDWADYKNFLKSTWVREETPDPDEYTLQEVLGNATVPSWARWGVVTKLGQVVMCELEPVPHNDSELWEFAGAYELVNRVVPPLDFTKCIWEIRR